MRAPVLDALTPFERAKLTENDLSSLCPRNYSRAQQASRNKTTPAKPKLKCWNTRRKLAPKHMGIVGRCRRAVLLVVIKKQSKKTLWLTALNVGWRQTVGHQPALDKWNLWFPKT